MSLGRLDHLGFGTYSAPEAARLVGINASRVRRWLGGYDHATGSSAPVWRGEYLRRDRFLELGFRDLMELRAISKFLVHGVSWRVVRRAHKRAEDLVGHPFPFSTKTFSTNGKLIFAEAETLGDPDAPPTDVCTGQGYFDEITKRITMGVDYGDDLLPERWLPLGRRRQVIIDPHRGYGQPIVKREGVPTHVLQAAVDAGDSPRKVARWFEVSLASLRDALEFERQLAA